MSTAAVVALIVALWLAWRRRPLLARDRASHVSDRWRRNHFYTHGKQ